MAKIRGWRSEARTHVGQVRTHNEDDLVDRPAAGLWAVADGMGGHAHGDHASGLIREALESLEPAANLEAYLEAVCSRLVAVDARLRAESGSGKAGSTIVALVAVDDRFACAWAGDSRLYRWRDGRLERLTQDHSLVQELVTSGTLTPEAAHRHPLSNRITRAVGIGGGLELEAATGELAVGDRYLLASDGLHGVVTDAVIARQIGRADLAAAADGLIEAAMQAGAPDNVTVVLVEVDHA